MRTRLLALGIVASLISVSAPARAADDAGWIQQAGNGSGSSIPVLKGFQIADVLYEEGRFAPAGKVPIEQHRWRGWGALREGSAWRLASVKGYDHGMEWTAPVPAWLRDPDGRDVPFIIGDATHLAVAFQDVRTDWPSFFIAYSTGGDPSATAPGLGGGTAVSNIHMAVSYDGASWFDDAPILQHTSGVIELGPSFKVGARVTDLAIDPTRSACTTAETSPWACPFMLTYTASSETGATSIALAGGDGYAPLGTLFRGRTAPLLSAGSSAWASAIVDMGKVRKRTEATGYELTYAGGTSVALSCAQGTRPCLSLGVASSSDGLTWTPNNPGRAAVEPGLPGAFWGTPQLTLGPLQLLDDKHPFGHAKGLYAYADNAGGMGTWLVYTAPMPTTAPTIVVGSPDNGIRNRSDTFIDLYINDDRGTVMGLDATTFELLIDGTPVTSQGASLSLSPSIVGSFYGPGIRAMVPGEQLRLADGVHTMDVSIRDRDSELGTLSTRFTVDTQPPVSTIETVTQHPLMLGAPFAWAALATGHTTDAVSGISRIRAVARNLAGIERIYDSLDPLGGWTITRDGTDPTHRWNWSWHPPSSDPFWAIPGQVKIGFFAVDEGRNGENYTSANSTTIIVI